MPHITMNTEREELPESEEEWRERLSPEEYRGLREKGTEAPFTRANLKEERDGTYVCAACGNPLFDSNAKFDSGSGWPSFDRAIAGSVQLIEDHTEHMARMEAVCTRCGSHLGHVFPDGPTETGDRYCMNSVSLEFVPNE